MSRYWNDVLSHYGVQGMKWGYRKYQNEDGTLTSEGRKRYLEGDVNKSLNNFATDFIPGTINAVNKANHAIIPKHKAEANKELNKINKDYDNIAMQMQGAYKQYSDIKQATSPDSIVARYKNIKASQAAADHAAQESGRRAVEESQRIAIMSSQEATRQAINASNMAASNAMTGGTNPFMFGMM